MGFSKVINPLIAKFPGVYIPPQFKQASLSPDQTPDDSYESPADPWEEPDPLVFYSTSRSVGFITNYVLKLTELIMLCSGGSRVKTARHKRPRKSKPV